MNHVLVVDDDDASEAFFREALVDAEIELLVAPSGAKAIAVTRKRVPEVIITEANLPDMSGWELASEIHRICPASPVIAITADDSWETARRMRTDGGPIFFFGVKPLTVREMRDVVQAALLWHDRHRNVCDD